MNDICIRPMTACDTLACTNVHVQSFPGFFLTFLGKQFLNELYSAIIQDPLGIALVAEDQGEIIGFAAGATYISGMYRHLIQKRLFRFAWASIGGLIRKPTILPRLLRAFSMPSSKEPVPNCGTLMSLAVVPGTQGRGVGRRLVNAFLTEAHQLGLENIMLTTDCDNNDRANLFYQRLGFSLSRTFTTPEGRRINEYIIPLEEAKIASIRRAASITEPVTRHSEVSAPVLTDQSLAKARQA